MKNIIDFIVKFIPFLEVYPMWIKGIVAAWLILTAITLIFLIFCHPSKLKINENKMHQISQKISADKINDSNVYQAARDINIYTKYSNFTIDSIQSINLEARLTCDLKEGEEIPPAEVMFIPIGDSHSYFKGSPGKTRLEFKSPVRFRRQNPNKIVVINNFSLESGSILQHKPLDIIKNYEILSVPIITVVFGKSLDKFTLLEVVLTVNGQDIWNESYKYNISFQVGPRFEIPLEELHKKL